IDGYRVNGTMPDPRDPDAPGWLVQNSADLPAGDLEITNDTDGTVAIPFADLTNPLVEGLNMAGAANLRDSINASALTETSAGLTTLVADSAAAAGGSENISFDLTGVEGTASLNFTVNGNAVETAHKVVEEINQVSDQTGIRAFRGNGSNGGSNNSVVLRNSEDGEEGAIQIAGLGVAEINRTGLDNFNQGADASHNTGYISFSSTEPFTFNDSAYSDGTLQNLGLKAGYVGITGTDNNDNPVYGFNHTGTLGQNDLKINGINIDAAAPDENSILYPAESAAAKAEAINARSDETGVTARITPAYKKADGVVEAGTLGSGDLVINGVDIFTANTALKSQDDDNTLLNAINDKEGKTGVAATRNAEGTILLKTIDGRNLHIETSTQGESLTHINGTSPPAAANQVYMGRVQLHSDQEFTLETGVFGLDKIEYGLEALGLAGGQLISGETGDKAGDGRITVNQVIEKQGSVRYAGDREDNLSIKTGRTDSMDISSNGDQAIMSTDIFSILCQLEDNLRGVNYHRVTGIHKAGDVTAALDSGKTGLAGEEDLKDGSFTVKVKDHEHSPPEELEFTIPVDAGQDSLSSVAVKINGVPGMEAYWNDNNQLEISTTEPDRYTYTVSEDTSNFLAVTGTDSETMQMQALDDSLAGLEDAFSEMTTRVSDFGARANRIEVQKQIYDNLELKVNENLSEVQDTDYTKAIMDLKAAQTAYQAALNSAGKTMQLSLVDYL
ncbi:MAG: flagellin, partial [Desulfobia sp.]